MGQLVLRTAISAAGEDRSEMRFSILSLSQLVVSCLRATCREEGELTKRVSVDSEGVRSINKHVT